MNKIILNDNIKYNLDNKIKYEYIDGLVKRLKLTIIEDTKLEININLKSEIKLDIQIEIEEDVKLELIEIKKNVKSKIQYKYNLKKNSNLEITKINDIDTINEKDIVNLNGENAKVDLILKTVSKNTEKYDLLINHNCSKTISDITTSGLNLKGNLYFTVSTYIPCGNKDCIANQNNRIINLNNNECVIKPNLLIEEVDVTANHSALIGSFKDDEIFYLQRLGIDKTTATKLLIEGFLKNKLTEKLANNFKKYWRWIWIVMIFYY